MRAEPFRAVTIALAVHQPAAVKKRVRTERATGEPSSWEKFFVGGNMRA